MRAYQGMAVCAVIASVSATLYGARGNVAGAIGAGAVSVALALLALAFVVADRGRP